MLLLAPMSLFPHQKLDWNIQRLEALLQEHPDDWVSRLELATLLWSSARFHGGGEPALNEALIQARRVLQQRTGEVGGHVIAGASLISLERIDAARNHLDQALEIGPDRADAHYVLALWHQAEGDRGSALEAMQLSNHLAPEAWEPHALLAVLLWGQVQEQGGPARAGRALESSMFHAVRALDLAPPPSEIPPLIYHVGITCLHTGRFEIANKLLSKLLEHPNLRTRAQYYLGLVHYQMGRYKNAVLYLKQHLQHAPESARVHARIGMAYLQLGEVVKAREACNQAIAIDPEDLQSRWTLGCALIEEGREDEALRAFREILSDAPHHTPAFRELARTHGHRGELGWLRKALRAEVSVFDRQPAGPAGGDPDEPGVPQISPRQVTRERVTALVETMGAAMDADAVPLLLDAMDLTTDESLRFTLWEAALELLSRSRAAEVARALEEPGLIYGGATGREVLALAPFLPEPLLVAGLQISEEDLRRAAVDRHGPARDVAAHRQAIDQERREARAWQALLLMAIASHGSPGGRALLERWSEEADADLADAARAALVMQGDEHAAEALRKRARGRGVHNLVDAMVAQVMAPRIRTPVRAADDGSLYTCVTCGRRTSEVEVMLLGDDVALCNHCLTEIARDRIELATTDPEATCALSGRGTFETGEMYSYRGLEVCREVVDHGLGLLEREAIDRYLAAQ